MTASALLLQLDDMHEGPATLLEAVAGLDAGALARAAAFAAALLLIGYPVFRLLLQRAEALAPARDLALERARALAIAASLVLVAALVALLVAQARAFVEPEEPITWPVIDAVLRSTWGHAWLARAAASLVGVAVALRTRPASWALALATLAVALTTPLTGHGAAGPLGPAVEIPLHGLHLLGAGLWLGTLAYLVAALLPAAARLAAHQRAQAVAVAVRGFSPLALVGAGTAGVAGVVLGALYLGGLAPLTGSLYGRMLLAKVALLALVALAGGYNWRRLLPRLHTPDADRTLSRSATVELAFTVLVLVATALLVNLPAPRA